MRTRLLLLACALTGLSIDGASAAEPCDRACLTRTSDQYLSAVVKHDPGTAQLAPSFRYTENSCFDGLSAHKSEVVKAIPGCTRIENGIRMTGPSADGTLWPRNLLTEVFTVEDGRIRGIWAAMHYMTPDVPTAPGW
jgi:hypothetical protein